jgi:hypothetical protein
MDNLCSGQAPIHFSAANDLDPVLREQTRNLIYIIGAPVIDTTARCSIHRYPRIHYPSACSYRGVCPSDKARHTSPSVSARSATAPSPLRVHWCPLHQHGSCGCKLRMMQMSEDKAASWTQRTACVCCHRIFLRVEMCAQKRCFQCMTSWPLSCVHGILVVLDGLFDWRNSGKSVDVGNQNIAYVHEKSVTCRIPEAAAGYSTSAEKRIKEGLTVELLQQLLGQTWLRMHGRKSTIDLELLAIIDNVAYMRTGRCFPSHQMHLLAT